MMAEMKVITFENRTSERRRAGAVFLVPCPLFRPQKE